MTSVKIQSLVSSFIGKAPPPRHRFPTLLEQIECGSHQQLAWRRSHPASTWGFNIFITATTVVSSMMIGFELDANIGSRLEERLGFVLADLLFLIIFFAEMLLRQNQQGWDYLLNGWNLFDFALVVINCVDIVVAVTDEDEGQLKLASTLRVLRLMRISMYIDKLQPLYGLWLLLRGMLNGIRTIAWTFAFLVLILYGCGVSMVTLTARDERIYSTWDLADQYISTTFGSMVTIVQVFTFDSWASDVVRPLVRTGSPGGAAVCIAAIVVCNYGILNIVIGLMVESVCIIKKQRNRGQVQSMEKLDKQLIDSIMESLCEVDTDGDGTLSFEEFEDMLEQDMFNYKLRLLGLRCDEAEELFNLLDAEGDGNLKPSELEYGIKRLRGVARGIDLTAFLGNMRCQTSRAIEHITRVRELIKRVDAMTQQLSRCNVVVHDELQERETNHKHQVGVVESAKHRHLCIAKLDQHKGTYFPGKFEADAQEHTGLPPGHVNC